MLNFVVYKQRHQQQQQLAVSCPVQPRGLLAGYHKLFTEITMKCKNNSKVSKF